MRLLSWALQQRQRERVAGYIGYHDLVDWWLAAFIPDERDHIQTVFKPMGPGGKLTQLNIGFCSAVRFLCDLSGWFNNKHDRHIAYRILTKASERALRGCSVLDAHFLDSTIITTYYPGRANPKYMAVAVSACEHQIGMAHQAAEAFLAEYPGFPLPTHTGYKQMAIIREKQRDWQSAIYLCTQAAAQGWAGDWDKRIKRVQKD